MRTRAISAVAVILLATAGCSATVQGHAGPERTAVAGPSTVNAKPKASVALPSPAPTHLAPAADRNAAAAVLRADDAYYQNEFNHGVMVSLARGTAGSFPAYHAWESKAFNDIQPSISAFKKADAHFNASDEPESISDWRDANGDLTGDLFTLANDSLGTGGPDDSAARATVRDDIRQEQKDFAAAERDAERVAAGR